MKMARTRERAQLEIAMLARRSASPSTGPVEHVVRGQARLTMPDTAAMKLVSLKPPSTKARRRWL
jgi:hypothetical protein